MNLLDISTKLNASAETSTLAAPDLGWRYEQVMGGAYAPSGAAT